MEAMDAWRRKCCIQHVQSPGILMPSGRVRNLHGPISKGFRCLARRLSAGSMAWTIVVNKARNDWFSPASEQNGYGPSTVNSAAQALVLSRMKSTPGLVAEDAAVNIKHRIWAESLPVLHLAIALYQRIETLGLDGSDDDKLLLLLFRTDWLLPTLLYAESLRTFLPSRIPTFHPDKAVRLLPAS
jgi:hypothetical protein